MPGSPVAVWIGASLLGRWLLSCFWQHATLTAVSGRSDLRGATNTQQLWWQNFCSRRTPPVELSSSSTTQSGHHLRTVQMTAEGTPFSGSMNTMALCDFDMERLRRTLTYLLTSLLSTWVRQQPSKSAKETFIYCCSDRQLQHGGTKRYTVKTNTRVKASFPRQPSYAGTWATTTVLRLFVWDYLGKPVPEETFTHSPIPIIIQPLSASSIYYNT